MSDFSGMEDVLREFLVESYENLDRLDQEFVTLEDDPHNKDILGSIFRTIHTIKGTSGFFGLSKLESVTHVGENLLSQLREGRKTLNPTITSTLLAMVDAVREILGHIESSESEGDGDYSPLVGRLTELVESADGEFAGAPVAAKPAAPAPPAATPAVEAKPAPVAALDPLSDPRLDPSLKADEDEDEPEPEEPASQKMTDAGRRAMGRLLVENGVTDEEMVADALRRQDEGDPRHIGEILVESAGVAPAEVKSALDKQQATSSKPKEGSVADSTLRVDVAHLDRLMNLAGELVLVRNQLLQYASRIDDSTFNPILQRLNLITTELQEGVMKTRMQPIGNVWNKFPRVVRDLSLAVGKHVRLEMDGKDTELDKTLLEAIKDPLTHIVRNSVDHGIESAEQRRAAGKPAEGVIRMSAYHEGGQVNIEIVDDGGGIDGDAVKRKAVERGLVTQEQADRMSERELVNLIFLPGFSTAAKVTNVSGRGVGMDVVKTNISRIGGMVDMQSRKGKGTTLKIKIPLTLAIIPALVVGCGGERFAVPQVSLLELVRLEGEDAKTSIEMIHGAPVYRLRGKLLPLVFLRDELGFEREEEPASVNIVVLQADDRPFGLVVDEITDTEEIVVKPLGRQLKQIPIFAGATIMGDGSVALILDVMGVAQQSGVVAENRERQLAEQAQVVDEREGDRQTLLMFSVADSRMAIPLDQVDRLEEIEIGRIEQAGDQEVIQYRGQILPLVRPSRYLPERRGQRRGGDAEAAKVVQVVVYSHEGRSYGLVVDDIQDVTEEVVTVKREATREGILGVVVVQGHITELLDVQRLARLVG